MPYPVHGSPEMNVDYWAQFLRQALEELGGQEFLIPGAKVHSYVGNLGRREGEDFLTFLRGSGLSFRQFVDLVPGTTLQIAPSPRSDMLVGFEGAVMPKPTSSVPALPPRRQLLVRQDAYDAFTRISESPFVYVRSSNDFTRDPGDAADQVPVPPVTLEGLLTDRRQFVDSLDDAEPEVREELRRGIDYSPNPLADFQRRVAEKGLLRHWHYFNYDIISQKIREWAQQNGLPVSAAWFEPRAERAAVQSPQAILSELSRFLTDDEVRSLRIPFRAVEEMFRATPHKRPE